MSNRNKNKRAANPTMQMSDLQLDQPAGQPDEVELIDEVSQLIEDEKNSSSSKDDATSGPLAHVEAISSRIQELTQSLQQQGASSEFHETRERLIEMEAHLAKLQNEVQKQNGRNDKLETGLQVVEALGQQIDALSEHVKSMQSSDPGEWKKCLEPLENGLESVTKDLQSAQELIAQQTESTAKLGAQSEKLDEIQQHLNDLSEKTRDKESFTALEKQLEQIQTAVQGDAPMHELLSRLESLIANQDPAEKFAALEKKLDSLGEQLQKLDRLDEIASRLESVADQSGHQEQWQGLANQLEPLTELAAVSETLTTVGKQVESLNDFVKLGALENETLDVSRFEEMAEQIKAIGQMLVEGNQSTTQAGSIDDAQLEKLQSSIDSLAARIPEGFESDGNTGFDASQLEENVSQLSEKLDALQRTMEDQVSADVGGSDNSERIDLLSSRLESLSEKLESGPGTALSVIADDNNQSDKIQQVTDKLDLTHSTVNELVNSLVPILDKVQGLETDISTDDDDTGLSDWEKQKRALLKGYGVDDGGADSSKSDDTPASSDDQDETAEPTPEKTELSTPEIDELKSQLEEKLRQAEVDLSIERAKLHQERRDLEDLQSELSRQQAKIDTASSNSPEENTEGDDSKSSGGRWSRFLGN